MNQKKVSPFSVKYIEMESLPYTPPEIERFISGNIPDNNFIMRPVDRELPVDENGKKWLDFGRQGRGRLLSELLSINEETKPYEGPNPDEEDIKWQSATSFRHLSAFLSDISVSFPNDSEWTEGEETKDLLYLYPIIRYRLFNPELVVYYPDHTDPVFQKYQEGRAIYNELVAKGESVPKEMTAELDSLAADLFHGEENAKRRAEHMDSSVQFILQSELGLIAILRIFYTQIEIDALFELLGDRQTNSKASKARLFSNSDELAGNEFGIAKIVTDNIVRGLKAANRNAAMYQYETSSTNPRLRRSAFKIVGKTTETEFVFDREKLAINSAEQFADKLMELRNAKVLQTFFALFKWANMQDSAVFRDVPISDIMGLILKANGPSKFNTPQRREFSEVLKLLASISFTVGIIGEEVNKKTGKGSPKLRERDVKLFDLESDYSVKKEYMSIPKESLDKDLHFDKSVITHFSGELLPGKAHLFATRANIYFDSLLHLDANKDAKAIVLGFQLQTRFNQMTNKEQAIELDRAFLVNLCDYQKTNQTKSSQATKQISNNLDKLIKAGIISKYTGLTNNDSDKVKIMPPKTQKPKEMA